MINKIFMKSYENLWFVKYLWKVMKLMICKIFMKSYETYDL
jgi:hypothetical protein